MILCTPSSWRTVILNVRSGCDTVNLSYRAPSDSPLFPKDGVHIADVTAFVTHNSSLDQEAQKRGTTFYLADRRFDMLPTVLSSDLCSLHGGVDRLTVSVIWTFDSGLNEVKSTWYGRSVIRNCAAMTYDQADNILQGKPPNRHNDTPPPPLTAGAPVEQSLLPELKKDLTLLTRLSRKLRIDREKFGGAVDLSSADVGSELKFTLAAGVPIKVSPKVDREIHHTIAEMMILANSTVATKIQRMFPECALLRKHDQASENRLGGYKEILEAGGIHLEGSDNKSLAKSLKQAEQTKNAAVRALLKTLATRAMSEALYVSSGSSEHVASYAHYGLGLDRYTHFTSPIRRYADVVVHKQLLATLDFERRSASPFVKNQMGRRALDSLPASQAMSVLSGEPGIAETDVDDDPDQLIEGAEKLVLSSSNPTETVEEERGPYSSSMIERICDGLNHHNRLAKLASSESQRLFLSLYFRSSTETTDGIVTSIRSNGFLCYVPRFDMRVHLFVRDRHGVVNMDPAHLGLKTDIGDPPSFGFPRSYRQLHAAEYKFDDERMEVFHPNSTKDFAVAKLDVISLALYCDEWDDRARVPSPRAIIATKTTTRQENKSRQPARDLNKAPYPVRQEKHNEPPKGLYALCRVNVSPRVEHVPILKTTGTAASCEKFSGRMVFNNFINPDTRSAQQSALQRQAAQSAAQRRLEVADMPRDPGYDSIRQTERAAMARQQRLLAEKRNARKSRQK